MLNYLDSRAGIQHDVFDRALDVLSPGHQPRHLVIMTHLLPLSSRWCFRNFRVPVIKGKGLETSSLGFSLRQMR